MAMDPQETPEEKSSLSTPPPQQNSGQVETSSLKQIRTYQGDIAFALQKQRESLVSIQRTEAAKRGDAPVAPRPRRNRTALFFLGSIVFIGLGAVGGWFAYNEFLRKTAPPIISAPSSRFISSEKSAAIDTSNLSRDGLISAITEAGGGVAENELKHIVLKDGNLETSSLTNAAGFLSILNTQTPGNLVRAFESDFMLGTLGEKRFIIFKLTSFENAFAGMLNWEENLAQDLGPIFSTAQVVKNITPESVFKDTVSKNKDTRVLYAPIEPGSGTTTPAMLYSFFDNKMLIITEDLDALQTLIERLTREILSR